MRPLHVTHPLAKTDDGPQGAAETAATAEASADQPLNINRQRLLQHAVDTRQGRPELLGGHSGHQSTRELCVEFIAKAKAGRGGKRNISGGRASVGLFIWNTYTVILPAP